MSQDHKIAVRTRFLEAMGHIIVTGSQGVTNKAAFAEKISEYPQSLTRILAGTNYPTVNNLVALCQVFAVNPSWLLLGQGSMYHTAPSLEERVKILENLIIPKASPLKPLPS